MGNVIKQIVAMHFVAFNIIWCNRVRSINGKQSVCLYKMETHFQSLCAGCATLKRTTTQRLLALFFPIMMSFQKRKLCTCTLSFYSNSLPIRTITRLIRCSYKNQTFLFIGFSRWGNPTLNSWICLRSQIRCLPEIFTSFNFQALCWRKSSRIIIIKTLLENDFIPIFVKFISSGFPKIEQLTILTQNWSY